MEIAIPGVALGLLYIASNQNKKSEGFSRLLNGLLIQIFLIKLS